MEIYKIHYQNIFENFRVSRGERNNLNIDEYIGKEVQEKELVKFLSI